MASPAPNGSASGSRPGLIPPGPPPGGPPGPPPGIPPMIAPGLYLGAPPIRPGGYPGFAPHPVMPNFPPPLPAGWSEHTAPDGITKYYYNSTTKESTYLRPTFSPFPAYPPPSIPAGSSFNAPNQKDSKESKKKKEKPKNKVPIPGTTWTRITTTEGNVFYFEKESKRSEWTVPMEIKDEVEKLEEEEMKVREAEALAEEEKRKEERLERLREQERIRAEVEEERRKKIERAEERKRKAEVGEDGVGEDEDGEKPKKIAKKAENGDAGAEAGEEVEGVLGPVDDEDEAAWMRAVAAEFAEMDQQQAEDDEQTRQDTKTKEEEAAKKVFAVPAKVNVSLEEGRALFKALLIEKDISPFMPWEESLPLFINDPRYVLLSSQKDRKEVYDEYCRDVGRARRLNKGLPGAQEKKVDPERDYRSLLRDEVTSTRTRYDDFKRKWKKDRRFYNYGRDDREREKLFKVHLRELGERKRADAQRAETDFFDLLSEIPGLSSSSIWSEAKKGISGDARYDAVGSSSLREELFKSYISKLATTSKVEETPEQAAERKLMERKAKQEASLREREQKIRSEQAKVQENVDKSKAGAGKEDGERLFGSLLVDQVRDFDTTWQDATKFLERDPRFNHPSLTIGNKRRLFESHISRLASRRTNDLSSLFATNTPSLDTPYEEVYPKIIDDPIVTRLNLEVDALEDRWKAWKRERESTARVEFDQMLGENSFVEFWGKMRKKVLDEKALELKEQDEVEEGEGIGDGGSADLTALAKQIDLNEIKSVLKRDKRYRQFDHIPEVREQWLRDYLENLDAASGSTTIHNVGQQHR